MKYRDVIQEMERHGNYFDADDLRDSLESNGINDHQRVHGRRDSYDGCNDYSVQRSAQEAYDRIRRRGEE